MIDRQLGDPVYILFTTRSLAGVPTTFGGTPVLSIYKYTNLTPIGTTADAAFTLTIDFDGITGLNAIDFSASTANGFASETEYNIVVTTGTVDGVSVIGEVVETVNIDYQKNMIQTVLDAEGLSSLVTAGSVTSTSGSGTQFSATGLSSTYNASTLLGCLVTIMTDSGATQNIGSTRAVVAYSTGTKTLTFYPGFPTNVSAGATFNIRRFGPVTADTRYINGAGLVGDGNTTPWDGA